MSSNQIIGLAIYNNVILDLHFPYLVYKKLNGQQATFEDLKEINPVCFFFWLSIQLNWDLVSLSGIRKIVGL